MSSRHVTLSDVARVAGVSLSTASKALNGNSRVSLATRERIAEVARRLDFQPNALAQSFARGRSQTIGILTQNAIATWSGPILVGAAKEFGTHEHATLLYDAGFDAATLEASIRRLQARRIDGLLVIGEGPHLAMRSVTHAFTVPVAYAFTSTDVPTDLIYLADNVQVGHLAASHLVEMGRRRIAHVTAANDPAAEDRIRGMREALAEHGLEPVAVRRRGSWWESDGEVLTAELLDAGVQFDALFCGNDHMARGAERALTGRGRRVPDDVALVGVDNWEGLIIKQGGHHLTTVDTRLSALGAAAARQLMSGEHAEGPHHLPAELIIGTTTTGTEREPDPSPPPLL